MIVHLGLHVGPYLALMWNVLNIWAREHGARISQLQLYSSLTFLFLLCLVPSLNFNIITFFEKKIVILLKLLKHS